MKISEIASSTGVSARSIRHYEKKRLLSARRLHNDYREFDESAIERIRSIQFYLGLGLNTDEIAELLCCDEIPELDDNCLEMLTTYENKLQEVQRQLQTLQAIEQRLLTRIHYIRSSHEVNASF